MSSSLPLQIELHAKEMALSRVELKFGPSALTIHGELPEWLRASALAWIDCYLQRAALPDLPPLTYPPLSPFQARVMKAIQAIPLGEVVSYGEIADAIGHPRAARAVGTVCRDNPFPLFIPCHRVVAANRSLCGFRFGTPLKQLLLDFEGVGTT